MTKEELLNIKIDGPDPSFYKKVREHWDSIAKPLDGMGRFEDIIARIGAIQRTDRVDISKKAVVIMCADNGIVKEGISQSQQDVTLKVVKNMARSMSSVGKMAKYAGADTIPVDIGINSREEIPGILNRKIMYGTNDFALEPAMGEEEALRAISVGIELAKDLKAQGYDLLAAGEMGIGNTTTSSAVCAALLKEDAEKVTGRGAGLDDERLKHKRNIIQQAIEKYDLYEKDAFTVLKTVGGLDIAGLLGLYTGAALSGLPVVLDGMISVAAAIAAIKMLPSVRGYLIPSHMGKEPGIRIALEAIEGWPEPVIHGDLALGEGTGAVMMMPLLDMAMTVYDTGSSFSDISVDRYERFGNK